MIGCYIRQVQPDLEPDQPTKKPPEMTIKKGLANRYF
jgi:hypothetical protein